MPAASIPLDCPVRTLGVLITRIAFEISSLALFFVFKLVRANDSRQRTVFGVKALEVLSHL